MTKVSLSPQQFEFMFFFPLWANVVMLPPNSTADSGLLVALLRMQNVPSYRHSGRG